MGRPQRNNVDYFPFMCEEGEKMFYLEETYGNDGFAVFVKLLRELAKVDYHYLNLSKKSSLMFLSARCKVSVETLENIIQDLSDLGKFDSDLWDNNKIVWCQDFIDSIQDAYSKRKNKCIDRFSLLILLDGLGVRKLSKKEKELSLLTIKGVKNTQSKVEESKVEESKVDYIETFTEFYEKYDYGKGRVNAEKEWSKLTEEEIKEALSKVEAYVKSTPDKNFRKNPANWISGQHWNDEIPTASDKKDSKDDELPWYARGFK